MIDLSELLAEAQEASSPVSQIVTAGFGMVGTLGMGFFGFLAHKRGTEKNEAVLEKVAVEHEKVAADEKVTKLEAEMDQVKIDLASVSMRRGDWENLPEIDARVLVIEDTAPDRFLTKIQLQDSPFVAEVEEAESIDQASIHIGRGNVRNQPFKLIVLDPGLGSTDGLDSVKQTLEIAEGIPVLVLTGRIDDTRFGADCLRAGAKAYMTKDQLIVSDELNRAILVALRTPRKRI